MKQSKQHYNITEWSGGYFMANDAGMLELRLSGADAVNLQSLIDDLVAQGLRLPLLIRFADILTAQVSKLYAAFAAARERYQYSGQFHYVYPIKTNQQRDVVETILSHEQAIGLEAGSKTELLAVLGVASRRTITIVCNGYKDAEYIQLALIAQQLGHQVFIIVELPSELSLILHEAKRMNIVPSLGFRVRLASIAKGKWQNTGGEKSKFGLTARQVQQCVEMLEREKCLSYLKVLHCHLGSQISNIRDIQRGINECARYYSTLVQMGAELEYVDIGGGLGVDYEGTHSRSACSINYSWQEYANNVVQLLKAVCVEKNITEPNIMTESGRAITAHHAVVVTNVIDIESPQVDVPTIESELAPVLTQMQDAYQRLDKKNAIEVYHDMAYLIAEAYQLFSHGALNISERAIAESVYQSALAKVRQLLDPSVKHHFAVIDSINEKLADKVFCNLSIFQSMPDVWAIQQVFPILPITHLNEPPAMRAVLQDLTCDSDGMVEQYVDGQGVESTLPLPQYDVDNPYLLGCFMVGAYQEILGDMHNLFGDTDSVHVKLDDCEKWQVTHMTHGDESEHVLQCVNYDIADLKNSYQQQIASAELTVAQRQSYLETLQNSLDGYTYFEK